MSFESLLELGRCENPEAARQFRKRQKMRKQSRKLHRKRNKHGRVGV